MWFSFFLPTLCQYTIHNTPFLLSHSNTWAGTPDGWSCSGSTSRLPPSWHHSWFVLCTARHLSQSGRRLVSYWNPCPHPFLLCLSPSFFALHPHCRAHHVSITIHNSSPTQDDVPNRTNIGVSRWTGVHYCCFFTTSSFSSSRTTLGAYFSSDRFTEPFCLLLPWMSQNSAQARTLQTGAVVTRG